MDSPASLKENKKQNLFAAVLLCVLLVYRSLDIISAKNALSLVAYSFSELGYLFLLLYALFYYKRKPKIGLIGAALCILSHLMFIASLTVSLIKHGYYRNYVIDIVLFLLQMGCYLMLAIFLSGKAKHFNHKAALVYSAIVLICKIIGGVMLSTSFIFVLVALLPILDELLIIHDVSVKKRALLPVGIIIAALLLWSGFIESTRHCSADGCENRAFGYSSLCTAHYRESHQDINYELYEGFS